MSLIVGYIQQTPVVLVLAATSIFCAASTFSLYWGERFFRERRQYKALLFPKVTIDTIVPEAEGFGITLWLVGKNTSNREMFVLCTSGFGQIQGRTNKDPKRQTAPISLAPHEPTKLQIPTVHGVNLGAAEIRGTINMHCAYGPKQGALKYTAHVEAEVQFATSTVDGETKVHMHHTFKTVQHEKR